MRHLVIDTHRRTRKLEFVFDGDAVESTETIRWTDLEDALTRLDRSMPRECSTLRRRYNECYSVPETAQSLNVSERTVKRDTREALDRLRCMW